MSYRTWGSLLLAFLVIGITMTMGCEKGALGVKPSTVMGRIVDGDDSTIPIAGAKVSMVSQAGFSAGGEIEAGFQYATLTNARGLFIFENVTPDQLVMTIEADGYLATEFPGASATKEYFYVGNGTTENLGDIRMFAIGKPLTRAEVAVRAFLADEVTGRELPDNKVISLFIDGKKFENRDIVYRELKNGINIPAAYKKYPYVIMTEDYQTLIVNGEGAMIDASIDNLLNLSLRPTACRKIVRMTIRDSKTKKELFPGTALSFYIDGQKQLNNGSELTYSDLKNGLNVSLPAISGGNYPFNIIVEKYKPYPAPEQVALAVIDSKDESNLAIEIEPLTYSVQVAFVNKPFYVNDLRREWVGDGWGQLHEPEKCHLTITSSLKGADEEYYQVVATTAVSMNPYEPTGILQDIYLPASLTVLLEGYREMSFPIPYQEGLIGTVALRLYMEPGAGLKNPGGVDIDAHKILRGTMVSMSILDGEYPDLELKFSAEGRARVLDVTYGGNGMSLWQFVAEGPNPQEFPLPSGYFLPFEILTYGESIATPGMLIRLFSSNHAYIEPIPMGPDNLATAPYPFTAHLLINRNQSLPLPN